jgi:NADP-dependent 3-hydroxy acid dehydrogenase YdfG
MQMAINKKLSTKVAIVAGFATPLSFGIIRSLLEENATVIVPVQSSRDILLLKDYLKGIGNGRLVTLLTDLPDYNKGIETIDAILEEYGQLDIVVAAFDYQQASSGLFEIANKDWQKAVEENITAYFICSRVSLDVMKKKKRGMFIGISDTRSISKEPRNAMANMVTALQMEISRQFYDEIKNTEIKFHHLFINDENTSQPPPNSMGNIGITPEMAGNHIINIYNGEAQGTDKLFQGFPGKSIPDVKNYCKVHS